MLQKSFYDDVFDIAEIVFYGKEDSLPYETLWNHVANSSAGIVPALSLFLQQVEAASGKPIGFDESMLVTQLSEFEDWIEESAGGLHEAEFIDFMVRNDTLPGHPWTSRPSTLQSVAQFQALQQALLAGDMGAIVSASMGVQPAPVSSLSPGQAELV